MVMQFASYLDLFECSDIMVIMHPNDHAASMSMQRKNNNTKNNNNRTTRYMWGKNNMSMQENMQWLMK